MSPFFCPTSSRPQLKATNLAASVTVVSIIRLHALIVLGKSANATWDNFPVSLWSTVEINVGIMCTCMPTLRLLLIRLFPALGGGTSYANGGYYHSGGRHESSTNRRGGRSHRRTRTFGELTTNQSKRSNSVRPDSSVDTVVSKPMGIVRQQTFAVQYDDDDEAGLVELRALGHTGRIYKSDDLN